MIEDGLDYARVQQVAQVMRGHVTEIAPRLIDMSHEIHRAPELRFQEREAAARVKHLLEDEGFSVTSPVAGMDTAFLAESRFGGDGPTVGVFCEYDALEGLGHACGHNIIASAGAGAGIVAARWLRDDGSDGAGRIVVVGSPAEEGGGGKVRLLEAGVLAALDAAVMVHPAGFDAVSMPNLGRVSLEVEFSGRASHAAAAPESGRNALDAATLLLVSIGLARQQIRSDSRIHAIVTDGGQAVNVIPERARLKVFIRSPDASYLESRLRDLVQRCADGAALATGTQVVVREDSPSYAPVSTNPVIGRVVSAVFQAIGRETRHFDGPSGGSTDMGNVSQVIPAAHPYISVAPGLAIHTRDFEAAAASARGDTAVVDGATLVGTTVAVLMARPELIEQAKTAHRERVSQTAGAKAAP